MNKIFVHLLWGLALVFMSCDSKIVKNDEHSISNQEELFGKGKVIAQASFTKLSTELKSAMEVGGVESAIQYCSISAIPLTDSLSKVHNASIRRVSDKYRNPINRPTAEELEVIKFYQQQANNNEQLKPLIREVHEKQVFYAPINIQELCLKCHGSLNEMPNYPVIKNTYPDDLATGYVLGDLRGIWSISFNK